ncbi:type I methionyl aminopeptidase [Proteinivorax hydrogeniformans]|uniref:Methionine aminopeptidase n=1 Tax=Proteinivorax hydrogeniformans TaxID=1826727 RepID=A0AAU8HU53_9FIRM
MIIIKSSREIGLLAEAGRITAEAHKVVSQAIKPGVTTKELDNIVEDYLLSKGAQPAFKGYHGFPASICASVNEEVVHGIPGGKTLKDGDIISIDIGAKVNGYHGDAAKTYAVGEISSEIKQLLKVTEESLMLGIEKATVGNRLYDISAAIQQHVERFNYGIVRDYAGHGIGQDMHEAPEIPNYGKEGQGPRLKAGMALAIEPMINLGTHRVKTLKDGWTVITLDKKPSAHFEHTIVITENGPKIMTVC